MNSKLSLLLICLFAFFLTGCGNQQVRGETVVEVLSPPDALLTDVKVEPPPNIADYTGLRYTDKEEILINLYRAQTQNVETANSQLKSIRDWKEKQLKLYQKKE